MASGIQPRHWNILPRRGAVLLLGASALSMIGSPAAATDDGAASIRHARLEPVYQAMPVQVADSARPPAFEIPGQALDGALRKFAALGDIQVIYDAELTMGLMSTPVSGAGSRQEALQRMLEGTGLVPHFNGPRSVTILAQATTVGTYTDLPTINVEGGQPDAAPVGGRESAWGPVDGYVAERSATGTKTDTPIIEIPQSVSVVPADQIRDQGAQTVSEALRYTPGILVERDGAAARTDIVRVRAFEAVQYLDGTVLPRYQDFARPRIDPYGLERIEVLKGPASVLYGKNSPGGIVNMVSKRPTAYRQNEVVFGFGSFNHLETAFDFSGPVTQDGAFQYRLTGRVQDAETQVDFTRDDSFFMAPALAWRPTSDTSFTLLTQYAEDKGTVPLQYVPAEGTLLPNPNGRISRSRFLGEPGFDRFDRDQYWIGYAFEHRFNDTWQIRQNLRYGEVGNDFQAYQALGLQPDLRTLDRAALRGVTDASSLTVDTQMQADFATGPLDHKLVFGLDYAKAKGDYLLTGNFAAPSIDVFEPDYTGFAPALAPIFATDQNQDQRGFYVQDQIKLDGLIFTLGIRRDKAESVSSSGAPSAPVVIDQEDAATTYRAGVTYLFDNGLAPYASYSTSFDPVIGTDRFGEPFEPTSGEQYEAGIKFQPRGSDTIMTAAVFDITQSNVLTPDPNDPTGLFDAQLGEVRAKGYEFEIRSDLTRNLEVIAGYSFIDTEVTESQRPEELGAQLPGTPQRTASAWAYYTFDTGIFAGFGIGAGIRYIGPSEGSPYTLEQPSYTLYDAAAHYDLDRISDALRGVRLNLTVTNIADEYYVTNCAPTTCFLGTERRFLSTLSYRW